MSFFSSAVRLIRKKGMKDSQDTIKVTDNAEFAESDKSLELDFSLRNYAKESFSVLIIHPLSACMHKILRAASFVISGVLVGGLIALITCLIALQFGSVENTVISAYLLNKVEEMLPDTDLSIKSAMLQWNSDASSVEICLNKVRFDDFFIPKVTILPNYTESFKQQRFVADTIFVEKPRISLDIANDFKTVSINPNLLKGGNNKVFFEPISSLKEIKDGLIGTNNNALIKIINADVSIAENGLRWNMQNLYCEHKLGEDLPRVIDFRSILPGQKYLSSIRIAKSLDGYDLKINSLNPAVVYESFISRGTPLEPFLPLIQGYNLPVSGDIKLQLNPNKTLKECSFNLIAADGSIRIPNRNTLALNLGKRIDNGSISGTIYGNRMNIDSINVSYGNSGVQLTGLSIPLINFHFLDVANVDGTLSLTNVNMKEMHTILPPNISKSIVPIFHNYLPGFRLDLLKFDLKGAIAFGDRISDERLSVSQGIFKIHDAKIPVGEHIATKVDATGVVKTDGLDIKISNAMFGNTKVNSGIFFISNQDNSWIGKVNADIPIMDISTYAPEFSDRLAALPLNKLGIKGTAKVDLKLVRVVDDKLEGQSLPFRMVEGDGTICSEGNAKQLKLSWNEHGLSAVADVNNGKNSTHFKIEEDFANGAGISDFRCKGNSEFLAELMPFAAQSLKENFDLKLTNSWDTKGETADIFVDLKNAALNLPVIGNVKTTEEVGKFSTHIRKYPDRILLSKMVLDTPKTKISGQITTDTNWNVTECVVDNIVMDGISAKANILKKNDSKAIVSLVGDSFDANKLLKLFGQAKKNMKLVTYLNIKELSFNDNKVKNVKGTLDILGGKIVNGACIGVIGESTIALNTKDIKNSNDYLLSISASNTGDFIKTLGIGDSINGGNISFVLKSSRITPDGSMAGAFEINNFLVKNNPQLTKLISLSSPNYLTGTDLVVGFNTCTGSIISTNGRIKIENCKAVGPTIAVSLDGEYDRVNDDWKISGLLLPMSSINAQNMSGHLAVNFGINGSYWNPNISVSTPKFVPNDTLSELFGNMIPQLNNTNYINNSTEAGAVIPISGIKDPYAQEAFDRAVPSASATASAPAKKKVRKIRHRDEKFGVKINRGLRSENTLDMGE